MFKTNPKHTGIYMMTKLHKEKLKQTTATNRGTGLHENKAEVGNFLFYFVKNIIISFHLSLIATV